MAQLKRKPRQDWAELDDPLDPPAPAWLRTVAVDHPEPTPRRLSQRFGFPLSLLGLLAVQLAAFAGMVPAALGIGAAFAMVIALLVRWGFFVLDNTPL